MLNFKSHGHKTHLDQPHSIKSIFKDLNIRFTFFIIRAQFVNVQKNISISPSHLDTSQDLIIPETPSLVQRPYYTHPIVWANTYVGNRYARSHSKVK